ncbi:Fe-S cluster assembly protein HesB [Rathayibacter sp. AY1E8]|uniref:HhH-GPD-type base excision DNA repair protein n=1 Tax=Rathayibacter sp. AY1E8 TaxID=2080555 RepID=UPI000CE7A8F5|nr:HhH-GPD-type base excision DNA repair protein [Rathayibacter sp. AY1E8]PPG16932.1 Fe-S cluster assembly protein HesB [Rathayibacter sp. AY1E8]
MTRDSALHITDDPDADALLSRDPLALLIGMLLDQQVAMETAFSGPRKIEERLEAEGASFDAASIAGFDEDAFSELCRTPPAIHRYPASMAGRVQVLCRALVDDWDGDAAAVWTRDEPDGRTVLARLKALPGFGEQKARIYLALLGKQRGFSGEGWRSAAGAYGEEGAFRSVADIVSPESLTKVRATKQAAKAAAKAEK